MLHIASRNGLVLFIIYYKPKKRPLLDTGESMSTVNFAEATSQCYAACGQAADAAFKTAKESVKYENISQQFNKAIEGYQLPFMAGTIVGTAVLYSLLSSRDKSTSMCRRGFNKCTAMAASLLLAGGASTLALANQETIKSVAEKAAEEVMKNMPKVRDEVVRLAGQVWDSMPNKNDIVTEANALMGTISNNLPAVTFGVTLSIGFIALAVADIAVEQERIKKKHI